MRNTIIETDDWIVQKDEDKKALIVSYFTEGHFNDDIFIPYEDVGINEMIQMFEVIYESQSNFQWSSDFIFNTYEDANKYLLSQGFSRTRNGFESNWDSCPKAYITPKKVYKGGNIPHVATQFR